MLNIDRSLSSAINSGEKIDQSKLTLTSDKDGRVWTLRYSSEEEQKIGHIGSESLQSTKINPQEISGKELYKLLNRIVNNKNPADQLITVRGQHIKVSQEVCQVSRKIIGILQETTSLSQKKARALASLKIIGQGLAKERAFGRTVLPDYWTKEILFANRQPPLTAPQAGLLKHFWEMDTKSPLSLLEWEAEQRKQWETSGASKDRPFVVWVNEQLTKRLEQDAYNEYVQSVKQGKNPLNIEEWRKEELSKSEGFAIPEWQMFLDSKKKTMTEFREWRTEIKRHCVKAWNEWKKETGSNLKFTEFDRLMLDFEQSGSTLSQKDYTKKIEWMKTDRSISFPDFVLHEEWEKEKHKDPNTLDFEPWKLSKEDDLRKRWIGSHLPLKFEQWKVQQGNDRFNESQPFIRLLTKKQRAIYAVNFHQQQDGEPYLKRNDHPFNTEFETTKHSGDGYAIFVIDQSEVCYAGSHIGDVFHHSSFLGDRPVLAAGELNTNQNGELIGISSKSGHYRPTDAENRYLLQYFKDKGFDLSKITFTFYDREGKTASHNAKEYLEELNRSAKTKESNKVTFDNGVVNLNNQPFVGDGKTAITIIFDDRGNAFLDINKKMLGVHFDPKKQQEYQKLEKDIIALEAEIFEGTKLRHPGRERQRKENLQANIVRKKEEQKVLRHLIKGEKAIGTGVINGVGEIKIGSNGKIIELIPRVGKYILSKEETIHMQNLLKARGVALKEKISNEAF